MEENNGSRFAGRLTKEYRLVAAAYPHIEEFQDTVATLCSESALQVSRSPAQIVEIGCGDGITTERLLARVANSKIVAVDIEPGMIERAKLLLDADLRTNSLTFECVDALDFFQKIPSQTVDIVVSVWTLHNLRKAYRSELLAEISRVIAPGGALISGDKYAQSGELHFQAFRTQLNRFFDAYIPLKKFEFLRDFIIHNVDDEIGDRVMFEQESVQELLDLEFSTAEFLYRKDMEAILVAKR